MRDFDKEINVEVIPLMDTDDNHTTQKLKNNDELGVLTLKNKVLFPGVLLPISVSRPKSKKLIKNAYEQDKLLAVVCQKNEANEPRENDIYMLGTAARVVRIQELPGSGMDLVILEGLDRIQIDIITAEKPFLKAQIHILNEQKIKRSDKEMIALAGSIKEVTMKVLQKRTDVPQEAYMAMQNLNDPTTVINFVCVNLWFPIADKQELLSMEIRERGLRVLSFLNDEYQMLTMRESIQREAQEEIDRHQKEYYLQEQMHAIQKQLGDTAEQDIEALRKRAKDKSWSKPTQRLFDDELKKLERMGVRNPEYPTQLNYLEVMLSLPWNTYSEDNYNLHNAEKQLNKDHFGMDDIKERILEHIAVLKNKDQAGSKKNENMKAPILCLYGPPGVGKTSLGRSIATALGRKYARISLGGLHDEAEIRGHRRTYIGAMPGRIIQNLQKVGTSNPVFVLDEIDKVSADYHGDPTSALLEVLDPEQNTTFHDNYLDIDYDLSKVLFIATANSLQTIPRPLLDRMELIEMTGYLQEEKEQIAKHHLIPKALDEHGVRKSQMRFAPEAIRTVIESYTRESGVRNLERELATVIRKTVYRMLKESEESVDTSEAQIEEQIDTSSKSKCVVIKTEDVKKALGKAKYTRDMYEGNEYVGCVTGLAWTQVGGEILTIETALSPSKTPALTLTGNLGDVMKESAMIALGYIKAHTTELGIQQEKIDTLSVHLHVPEGAIPKDGPSAGITMTTAMVSAFAGKKVRERIAMTGEMTLRGKVLPVGGIKEKILAAKRAGITDIILCKDNEKDIQEIKAVYCKGVNFHYVSDIHEVIDYALL